MADRSPDPRQLGRYFALAMVGMEMFVPVVVGLLLDNWLGWAPWGVTCGAILGLAGGLYHLVVLSKTFNRKEPPRQE
ncbi:MAG TPA: hypothetical protein VEL76_18110 [Gemmataceae bacterium]|nr:hypothetical protein [Gemmataceae bacterium]